MRKRQDHYLLPRSYVRVTFLQGGKPRSFALVCTRLFDNVAEKASDCSQKTLLSDAVFSVAEEWYKDPEASLRANRAKTCASSMQIHNFCAEQYTVEHLSEILAPDLKPLIVVNMTRKSNAYDVNRDFGFKVLRFDAQCNGKLPMMKQTRDTVKRVFDAIARYYEKNGDETATPCVVMHCTHGVNRTGFLFLCLLAKTPHSTEELVELFVQTRGYKITKEHFIQHFADNRDKLNCAVDVLQVEAVLAPPFKTRQYLNNEKACFV